MATVATVTLIDRKGSESGTQRTAEDLYRVTFTPGSGTPDFNDARMAIDPSTALKVPRRGDPYSLTDPGLICKSNDPAIERPPDPQAWLVPVKFDNTVTFIDNDDPLQDRAIVRWGSRVDNQPIYKDRLGQVITNSAGEVFDPPVQQDIYDRVVQIQRNVQFHDDVIAEAYLGLLNSVSFNIRGASSPIAAFKAKIVEFTGEEAARNGINYWVQNIVIETRRDGWVRRLLDHGFSERDPITGKPTLVKDSDGLPLNEPVLLDGLGRKLQPNQPAVFLPKELDSFVDYNGLQLPQGF